MGLDWFLVATKAFGGGTPDLISVVEVLGYMELYRQKKHVRRARRAPRGRGRAQGGAPSTLVTSSETSWSRVQVSWITFGEEITFPKVLFRLDSA